MNETAIRILVIEDDPELRRVISTVLEAEGYQVTTAEGGRQAVEAARQATFDLVVADIRMEGMDGLQALESIQSQQPEVKSLVVTGYSTEADSIRAIRLGVSEYLTKPFRLDKFLDAINAVVAQRRKELERQAERDRLRRTLLWATRLVGTYQDRQSSGRRRPLLDTARLAARTAAEVGLAPVSCQQVELATLLAGLRAGGELEGDSDSQPAIPPAIVRILESLNERWDGEGGPEGLSGEQIPLESRLVAAALAARELPPGRDFAHLEQVDPGRLEPRLLEVMGRPPSESSGTGRLEPNQRRGLLSLARAFEEAENTASAIAAYRSVVEDDVLSRERVEALVGLSRLSGGEEGLTLAREAMADATQVGPWTEGWAGLQVGVAQAAGYPAESDRWIRRAGRLYTQMGDGLGQARAALALAVVSPEAVKQDSLAPHVQVLLRPENRSQVVEISRWVLPYLLSQPVLSEPLLRLARRVLWEAPRTMSGLLRTGRLDAAARGRAVELLAGMGGTAAAQLLQELGRDHHPSVKEAALATLEEAEQGVESTSPLLRIFSLGPFEVYRGEERVGEDEWKTQKIKFLMALLAGQAGQPLGQDKILEIYWPHDVEKGKQSLYWSTGVLRKVLEPVHTDRKTTILRRQKALYLNPEMNRWHDLEELERQLAQMGPVTTEHEVDFLRYRPLLELYRGPYLEDCYDDWAQARRQRLSDQAGAALLAVAQAALRKEQLETALEYAGRLTELDPLHTEGGLALMQAQVGLKRYEHAVRYFEALQNGLAEELDMKPPIPMVEVYQRAKLSL